MTGLVMGYRLLGVGRRSRNLTEIRDAADRGGVASVGMVSVQELPSPALLLDRAKLENNLDRMRARTEALGVRLRPHLKTAKSIDIARLAVGTGGPIAVSTLAEAKYFSDHGFGDLLYAVGVSPSKLDVVAALRSRGCDLQVVVDSLEIAELVADEQDASVWIEIDSDGRRAGVPPDDESTLIRIAETLGETLVGVMTHCGGSYSAGDDLERLGFARMERDAVVSAASTIRDAGLECREVSVGSTPTMTIADDLTGVTEARPGVYMFMDLFQAGLGACAIDDIAISVRATVIGRRRDGAVIDAGALALSLDRSTACQEIDMGFGLVCDPDGHPIDDLIVQRVSQEHGVVVSRSEGPVDLPLGSTVRVLPNHACITAASHDCYHVVVDGSVVDRWGRCNGW